VLAIAEFMNPCYKIKSIEFNFLRVVMVTQKPVMFWRSSASYMMVIWSKRRKRCIHRLIQVQEEDEEDEEEGSQSHKYAKKECHD